MIPNNDKIEAVVIGASAGGIKALGKILQDLPFDYPFPIIIVLYSKIRSEKRIKKLKLFYLT